MGGGDAVRDEIDEFAAEEEREYGADEAGDGD